MGSTKLVVRGILALAALAAVAQLVPYGRDHQSPPPGAEPPWDSPATRALAARACFDCHSNQTRWPWYARVAPVSWLLQSHVEEGREHLNFSEWHKPQRHAKDAAAAVTAGEMPLSSYTWLHPEARLSDTERHDLARGLAATTGREAAAAPRHEQD